MDVISTIIGIIDMKYVERILNIRSDLEKKSCFLFGPRQTGKTSLIRNTLNQYKNYNLLKTDVYLSLSRSPNRLREEVTNNDKIIIIDEIQKLPILLDEVQNLIEEKGIHFLLTGSSARKLRSKGVNLLGGRARVKHLHPLIWKELNHDFNLIKALDVGLIPSIYFSEDPYEDLESYVGNYLKEEIAAEAIVRNIPAFSRFLTVAGLSNGSMINYSNISSDAEVAKSTVQEYFQILRDTLVGSDLPAWKQSTKRKPISTAKFYFFDIGVARFLQNRKGLLPNSPEFGEAFESYFFHELKSYCDYTGIKDLHYWRSKSGMEVDFILNNEIAIEIKAKSRISHKDLKGLRAIKEESLLKKYMLISLEDNYRQVDGIEIFPWQMFLKNLWDNAII